MAFIKFNPESVLWFPIVVIAKTIDPQKSNKHVLFFFFKEKKISLI